MKFEIAHQESRWLIRLGLHGGVDRLLDLLGQLMLVQVGLNCLCSPLYRSDHWEKPERSV